MVPPTSVLIVDDEPAVRDLMARWASGLGLVPGTAATAAEALEVLRQRHHDLAVIDMMMPGRNGLWLAGELRRDHPNTAIIVATAHTDLLNEAAAETPIADFLLKPFRRERFVLAVDRGREWRRHTIAELHWHVQLSIEVRERIVTISHDIASRRGGGPDEAGLLTVLASERIPDVVLHSERVAGLSAATAQQLHLSDLMIADIGVAARFHDIGKLAMPEPLLTKPSPLTPGEAAIMRQHVDASAQILAATLSLARFAPLVAASHEWFGGGGYPAMLAGGAIPLASRILAVADAYDAMTQDRSYRARMDSADAIAELLRCSPCQFDPDVVVAFLTILGTP
jgi:response regulator RpfG family c-di-GMP phosphodiesterase